MGSGLGTALKMLTAWELEQQLALDLGLGGLSRRLGVSLTACCPEVGGPGWQEWCTPWHWHGRAPRHGRALPVDGA